ncbi:MAG: hypothetical protein ACFUZC_19565 [Chthoniobacteraceae bacterium]
MNKVQRILIASLLAACAFQPLQAQTSSTQPEIFPLSKTSDISAIVAQKSTLSIVEQEGKAKLKVEFQPGAQFPNVQFLKPGEIRDLSAFTGVQADITNTYKEPMRIGMRVDNAGEPDAKPWNTGGAVIAPGETKTIQVVFGMSWGSPAFALNPKAVTAIQIYGFSPDGGSAILISDLKGF